jgi:hypothetical protein
MLGQDNIDLDPHFVKILLRKALDALGGAVNDTRPTPEQQELIEDGRAPLPLLSDTAGLKLPEPVVDWILGKKEDQ